MVALFFIIAVFNNRYIITDLNDVMWRRVFLDDFTTQGFKIRFTYWYSPPEYWDFKAFGDKLNLEICRKFKEHQIQFSLPRRVSYWAKENEQLPMEIKMISSD